MSPTKPLLLSLPKSPAKRASSATASGHALFYVVPVKGDVDHGVVLVDTGFDESGADLKKALAGRPVRAVLLTHAHIDHWSGVHTLDVVGVDGAGPVVYAGAEDAAILEGRREYRSFAQTLLNHLYPKPQLPKHLRSVVDGEVVSVGGEEFVARHLPGHSPGSTVWLWRNTAFTGDALFGEADGSLSMAPTLLSDDDEQARRSVSLLWGMAPTILLDGHGGRTDHAAAHIQRFLDRH